MCEENIKESDFSFVKELEEGKCYVFYLSGDYPQYVFDNVADNLSKLKTSFEFIVLPDDVEFEECSKNQLQSIKQYINEILERSDENE